MRDEGLLILEWVAHYRALGFDTIFIYTNDNIDRSDDLLLALHNAGAIQLAWNVAPPGASAQFKAYRHAFWHSPEVWEHEWVAFLDADELLMPVIDDTLTPIDLYIDHLSGTLGASSISLNWRWFPGQGEFTHTSGLLCERFRHAFWQQHVKTLFRIRAAKDVYIHYVDLLDGVAVNGTGEPRTGTHHEPPSWRFGQINHYWNRTFEEYYVKRQRGRPALDPRPRDWSQFFHWSGEVEAERFPDQAHVSRIRAGADELRSLTGVADAEKQVLAGFRRRVDSPDIRTIYDRARTEPNLRPPIAWTPA